MLCKVVIQPQNCLDLEKFKVNTCLHQTAIVFDLVTSSPAEIKSTGENALVAVYCWKKIDSLDSLHFAKHSNKVA